MQAIYVWVLPARLLAPPSYRRARFDRQAGANRITCLVGDAPGALPIDQTFKLSRLVSNTGRRHVYRPAKANGLYAFVLEGDVEIGGAILACRDSIALQDEDAVDIAVRSGGADMLLVETRL
jgi:redox-sensitive bicupin YhaK (pirin superfamily)